MNIDFKKYKRFFAFGCSFTSYIWPTWADIISKEMPDAEYHNAGHCGAGNLMISARIAEASLKFKFTDTDLVIVMWSTFCREDRYFKNAWQCPGNIFTQNLYDNKFIKKFADTRGYLIRDLVLITNTMGYLKSLPCTSINLCSVPFSYQNENNNISDVISVFDNTIKEIPSSLFVLEMKEEWVNGHFYSHSAHGNNFGDYHPDPLRYHGYLQKLGINLTSKSYNFAKDSFFRLKKSKTDTDISNFFPNNSQGNVKGWL